MSLMPNFLFYMTSKLSVGGCLSFIVCTIEMNWKEIDFRVWEAKMIIELMVHQDGVKRANSLEWHSAVAYVR